MDGPLQKDFKLIADAEAGATGTDIHMVRNAITVYQFVVFLQERRPLEEDDLTLFREAEAKLDRIASKYRRRVAEERARQAGLIE